MTTMGQDRPLGGLKITALILLLAVMAACTAKGPRQPERAATVPVVVATAALKNIPVQVRAIGAVESFWTVGVKSMVAGELTNVYFKEGDDVKKGDLLFTIDKRPLEADLAQQEATLARDIAQAANARSQAHRYQTLLQEGVVAKEQTEQMQTNADALDAAVRADRAALDNAKVQLQYCSIYAPISGRTGNLMVHGGNVVKSNDIALVTINQITPTYATFAVPEQFLPDIKKHMARGKLRVEAGAPGQPPAQGTLSFVDNAVDAATGTIKLKGLFPNAERRLWPGQFVNVVLTLTVQSGAVVVPSQAVQTGQQGQYVYVVKSDMTAESRPVVLDRIVEGEAVIQKGVQPGEVVVTDGHLRLVPGAKVETKAAVSPRNGAAATGAKQESGS